MLRSGEKKTYKVVAKLYVNGKPAYYQNEDFYTYKVSGLYGENIDFDTIKAEAVEQAKQIKKASASYTAVILEDHEPNPRLHDLWRASARSGYALCQGQCQDRRECRDLPVL